MFAATLRKTMKNRKPLTSCFTVLHEYIVDERWRLTRSTRVRATRFRPICDINLDDGHCARGELTHKRSRPRGGRCGYFISSTPGCPSKSWYEKLRCQFLAPRPRPRPPTRSNPSPPQSSVTSYLGGGIDDNVLVIAEAAIEAGSRKRTISACRRVGT